MKAMIRKANNNIQLQGFLQMQKAWEIKVNIVRNKSTKQQLPSIDKAMSSSLPAAEGQFNKIKETRVLVWVHNFTWA